MGFLEVLHKGSVAFLYFLFNKEVESENPNPEEVLESANNLLLAIGENQEFKRMIVKALFFKGCALLELDRSKEGCKSWGKIIFNYRDDTDSEVSKYVIASYGMLDEVHGCPRCGSCHVKKTTYRASSMAKHTAGHVGAHVGAQVGTVVGATIGTFILPGIGSAVGGFLGTMLGAAGGHTGGEGLAEAAMSGTVRECPDCGYEF